MEEQVDRLVKKTWEKFEDLPKSQRLLIGVSGIPGSGTTSIFSLHRPNLSTFFRSESIDTKLFLPHRKDYISHNRREQDQ